MRIEVTKPLFAWDCLEDSPTLQPIRQLLEVIPDGRLLTSLENRRGKGRNDYPLRTLWGVLVLSIALRHQTIEACLGELRRNESLRRLIGMSRRMLSRKSGTCRGFSTPSAANRTCPCSTRSLIP